MLRFCAFAGLSLIHILIENIFEFNNQSAEDIMVHRTDMEIIWTDDEPQKILERIEQTGLSRFPVCNEDADDIVGILNARDYLINAQKSQPKPCLLYTSRCV